MKNPWDTLQSWNTGREQAIENLAERMIAPPMAKPLAWRGTTQATITQYGASVMATPQRLRKSRFNTLPAEAEAKIRLYAARHPGFTSHDLGNKVFPGLTDNSVRSYLGRACGRGGFLRSELSGKNPDGSYKRYHLI